MNETIKIIKNHRSIRSFLDKPVDNVIIDEILSAAQAMQTPSMDSRLLSS